MIVKTSNGLAVCLREWQLRELDHDQHLALLGMSKKEKSSDYG